MYSTALRRLCSAPRVGDCLLFSVNPAARFQTYRNVSGARDEKMFIPKQPKGAFFQYSEDVKPDVIKNNPDIRPQELVKRIGFMWQQLPAHQKQRYKNDAGALMNEWKVQKEKYLSSLSDEEQFSIKEEVRKRRTNLEQRRELMKVKQELPEPKKPLNCQFRFARDVELKREPGVSLKDYNEHVLANWNELQPNEKAVYERLHQIENQTYKEEYGIWVQKMMLAGYGEYLKPIQIKNELERLGKPKQGCNAYALFLQSKAGEIKGNVTKELAKLWMKVSATEKEKLVTESEKMLDAAQKAKEKWYQDIKKNPQIEKFVTAAESYLVTLKKARVRLQKADDQPKEKKTVTERVVAVPKKKSVTKQKPRKK